MTDPQKLTADLVKCPSVTPEEGGALVLLEEVLSAAGFECARADRGGGWMALWSRRDGYEIGRGGLCGGGD